jgi:hypothetical protein
MNSQNIEHSNCMITQYDFLREETTVMFLIQKNKLIESVNEILNLSTNFMDSENFMKFKSLFDSTFFDKQSVLQQFLDFQEAQIGVK